MVLYEKKKSTALTSLIHVFSHDIRNPLSAIIGYMEVLVEEERRHEKKSIMDRVIQVAYRMDQIIEMVNSQEALRLEKHELKLEEVQLLACVQNTMEIFESKLRLKSLSWDIKNQEDLESISVKADSTALTYCVFSNIVSNAIKFSSDHSKISWNIEVGAESIVVQVIDRGVGLSHEELQKINGGEFLDSKDGTHGEEGTGFGLQQIHRFLSLMGGKILFGKEHR